MNNFVLYIFLQRYLDWLNQHLPEFLVKMIVVFQAIIALLFLTTTGQFILGSFVGGLFMYYYLEVRTKITRSGQRKKDDRISFKRFQVFPQILEKMVLQVKFFANEAFVDKDDLLLSFDAGRNWYPYNISGFKRHRHRDFLKKIEGTITSGINWEYDRRWKLIKEIEVASKIDFDSPNAMERIQKLRDVGIYVAYLR